ncbi:lactate racemase domain-containing protein [Brachybacterium sp. JHP9]|uniref:Lactate racemase domain-containing protein n=1 Tax=Brachybacterium equifaecis TaxID=2910770 RepID=A0ABT0R2X3_9MICO|nr:lactate racemase domain-containing protein [Brachybacterium equifaecis]MCL6424288.1 lactate racemase domain-containing protein [Brachybacterium equifaecis]
MNEPMTSSHPDPAADLAAQPAAETAQPAAETAPPETAVAAAGEDAPPAAAEAAQPAGPSADALQAPPVKPIPEGLAESAALIGGPEGILSQEQIEDFVAEQLGGADIDGKSVCVIVPDGTRSVPLARVMPSVHKALAGRARSITVLIALGTHAAMDEPAIAKLLGYEAGKLHETYPEFEVVNHAWDDESQIADLGEISAERITELSGGLLNDTPMRVQINRLCVESDVNLVVGPVFPHEVVGFSGGNKYFFPGCSVHDVIDISHWVGALITASRIIGALGITPVRELIDAATDLIDAEKLCLAMVSQGSSELYAMSFGSTQAAWAACAKIAAHTHIEYDEKPYQRIIAVMPEMYEDIWTGAKGFYKLEPVCADGGEVIIYAPHITEVAEMHPGLRDIGYHNIEYFTKQWDRFGTHAWGELAHSTHVTGLGTYDPETGEEKNRVRRSFATRIPKEVCEAYNVTYVDPDSLDLDALRKDPDTLVVDHAGETLHRLVSEKQGL